MDVLKIIDKLKKSKKFDHWKKNKKNIFFSYAFKILNDDNFLGWQIGYYNKDNDKMTTFSIIDDNIDIEKEEEIFKKPDMSVIKIDMEKIKIPFEKILEKVKEFKKKKYPNEIEEKIIVVLQNLEKFGNIWNLTYLTKAFNTLNVKVNPENGEILHHKLSSIFAFKKE